MSKNQREIITVELEKLLSQDIEYGELILKITIHDKQIRYVRTSVESQVKIEA